jgi:hypothetical protein
MLHRKILRLLLDSHVMADAPANYFRLTNVRGEISAVIPEPIIDVHLHEPSKMDQTVLFLSKGNQIWKNP